MNVSGFTFVRNGVKFDYPFIESISSLLPLCDEVIVAVGNSEDDTLERLTSLNEPKIRIIKTIWDDSLRSGGAVLAQQTDIALHEIRGDWGIYLQADEVLHEADYPTIRTTLKEHLPNQRIEGFVLDYLHFYGRYNLVGASRRWYRREVRIVRPGIGIHSWGDAQGFRRNGQKVRARHLPANVYHYGWVKPPEIQQAKQLQFNKFWHDDTWIERHVQPTAEFDYSRGGRLKAFNGEHPAVMSERMRRMNWSYTYDPQRVQRPLREKMLDTIEDWTGWRIGEYKNYKLI
ncbi:MAG: glycosyltransferase family 2 protein [Ignavibacteriales bacterium]|nr:glycosyltransferase family 2 protein [Ignavibacteriales bacterium]